MKPEAIDAGRALEVQLRASAKRYTRAADVVADLRETLARQPDAASETESAEGLPPLRGGREGLKSKPTGCSWHTLFCRMRRALIPAPAARQHVP